MGATMPLEVTEEMAEDVGIARALGFGPHPPPFQFDGNTELGEAERLGFMVQYEMYWAIDKDHYLYQGEWKQ